jgi:hypothetical protein
MSGGNNTVSHPSFNFCGSGHASQRRGIVLVAIVAVFAISLTLFGVWAKAAIQNQQRIGNQQFRMQAVRLAEAGLRRAMARRAADPQYNEEVWHVPAEMLDEPNAAEVRIRILAGDNMAMLRYEATAEFPARAVRRAQITRRIDLTIPAQEDEL